MQKDPQQMKLQLNSKSENAVPVRKQRELIETLSELLFRAASVNAAQMIDEAHDDHEDR